MPSPRALDKYLKLLAIFSFVIVILLFLGRIDFQSFLGLLGIVFSVIPLLLDLSYKRFQERIEQLILGLTTLQFRILRALEEKDKASEDQLATGLRHDVADISLALRYLELKGYVHTKAEGGTLYYMLTTQGASTIKFYSSAKERDTPY